MARSRLTCIKQLPSVRKCKQGNLAQALAMFTHSMQYAAPASITAKKSPRTSSKKHAIPVVPAMAYLLLPVLSAGDVMPPVCTPLPQVSLQCDGARSCCGGSQGASHEAGRPDQAAWQPPGPSSCDEQQQGVRGYG